MLDWQEPLAARYASLSESRMGPVFFIEHGLAETERADLIADVRAAVMVHSLDSEWWELRKLPLIVASTEAGYGYRGSGTDFWPMLERELGIELGNASRQRVRDLFASAAEVYRGIHPPRTPWAEAFHLIAWPITHALIPREFHQPLALTLANLRASVADLDDEALHRAARMNDERTRGESNVTGCASSQVCQSASKFDQGTASKFDQVMSAVCGVGSGRSCCRSR